MRKKLFTLLLAIVAGIGTMNAEEIIYDVKIDGLYYILFRPERVEEDDDFSAQLTNPPYGNTDYDQLTTVDIPSYVTYEGDTYIVRSIGGAAFYNCNNLISVTIPNTIWSIQNSAFGNCSTLTSINIPDSASSIGDYAFEGCSALPEITIPESVTSLGSSAFENCINLSSIVMSDNIKSIGRSTFKGCGSLQSITIPYRTTTVAEDAFEDCTSLKNIEWNSEYTYDFQYAASPFYKIRKNITSITFGVGVTKIPNYLCYDMTNLQSVTIHCGVTKIGYNTFDFCNPNIIYFMGDLTEWCTKGWSPASITRVYTLYINNQLVADVVVSDKVEKISDYAFAGCTNLSSAVIPNSIEEIGKYAFARCGNMTSVLLSNNITKLKTGTFTDCTSLTSIVLPQNISSIENDAFAYCSNLMDIYTESTTPPSIYSGTFSYINSANIVHIPFGCTNIYKSTDFWKNMNLQVDVYQYINSFSTSCSVRFSIKGQIASCSIEGGEQQPGNVLEYIGLDPGSEYKDVPVVLTSTEGLTETVNVSFTTAALELTTKPSKTMSSTTAILLAETNMSDAEVSCGFEYKRNDAPADMDGTKVFCPVASGQMAGRLKNLKDDVYYKYRAFYQSAAGNMYYGEWQYIFTGDVAVEFDPILYTYGATVVRETEATISGYALAGSEDFTEQGFEYWAESRVNVQGDNAPRHMPSAVGEHFFAQASGIKMTVTLTDLDEGTVYKYRAYGKVGNQYYYGSEQTFTTQGEWQEPQGIEDVQGDNVQATKAHKILRNGQIFILRGEKIYTITGQKMK